MPVYPGCDYHFFPTLMWVEEYRVVQCW